MRSIEDIQTDLERLRERASRLSLSALEAEHDTETIRVAGELLGLELSALEAEVQALIGGSKTITERSIG